MILFLNVIGSNFKKGEMGEKNFLNDFCSSFILREVWKGCEGVHIT